MDIQEKVFITRCLLEKNALVPPCPHLPDFSKCTLFFFKESISAAEEEDEDEKVLYSFFVLSLFFPLVSD